jgi:hypothetical protein
MIFYPSFGNYKGLLQSNLVQEYVEHKADFEHEYYQELNTLKQADMATLHF